MILTNAALAQQANFVQFAYNMYALGGLQPKPDPGIDTAGYQFLYWLNAKDLGVPRFFGYLAESKTNPGDLVIVVRGDEDAKAWLLDFAAIPVLMPGIGFVALGFLSIFNTFVFVDATGAPLTLNDVVTKLNPANVDVVGHSLGAALSTLAAVQLATLLPNVASFTFGSPRVGLLDFASHFNTVVKTSYRVWNALDVVPEVPTFPYIHVSGKGDELVQSQQQLSELAYSPACEHHLSSYLWLLDPANFQLDPSCMAHAIHPAMSGAAGVSTDHSPGVDAIRKGARGRL